MPKYKPMLIRFDEDGYNNTVKRAEEKINIFHQALLLARKDIIVSELDIFGESFTEYFKEQLYESNRDKIQLNISMEKLLYLMDIDLTRLERLEQNYKSNSAPIDFIDQHHDSEEVLPIHRVEKKDYQIYTTSAKQNEMLRPGKAIIEAIQTASKFVTVYPYNIGKATSNLIQYDLRKGEYYVNVSGRTF